MQKKLIINFSTSKKGVQSMLDTGDLEYLVVNKLDGKMTSDIVLSFKNKDEISVRIDEVSFSIEDQGATIELSDFEKVKSENKSLSQQLKDRDKEIKKYKLLLSKVKSVTDSFGEI